MTLDVFSATSITTLIRSIDGSTLLPPEALAEEEHAVYQLVRTLGISIKGLQGLENGHSCTVCIPGVKLPSLKKRTTSVRTLEHPQSRLTQYFFTQVDSASMQIRTRFYKQSVHDGSVVLNGDDIKFICGE